MRFNFWVHYLTRPFDLFGTSLWQEWYADKQCKEFFGANMARALFVEDRFGNVHLYRNFFQLARFVYGARKLVRKRPEQCLNLLEEGEQSNARAERLLRGEEKFSNLEDGIRFMNNNALLATVLAYQVPHFVKKSSKHTQLTELAENLRGISYYPRIISELIVPLAAREVGVSTTEVGLLTLQEVRDRNNGNLAERVKAKQDGNCFVYEVNSTQEKIFWEKDTSSRIQKLERSLGKKAATLKGTSTYLGVHTGIVRVVTNYKFQNVVFNEGDILVTINSNPNFMPLIKKAGAIVTDEGRVTCHAAIISRELKIPCIIGTKIATQVLKDGDMVEVDADNGIVRKL